jgi:hypothetical protein
LFKEYSLTGEVYHEAGFDALMTGIAWFKLMTLFDKSHIYPGVESIMTNE